VYDEKANLINYVFLARDITDEVRFQRQILQVQKMEAMGNLAGGIANNLKNAFTPILIDTEMLMEDLGERDLSYPILQEMLQATRYGIDLVRHLLIFSGRTSPQKKPIDIVSVFREALNFLRASLPSTIEIKKAVRTDRAMVFADPTQIKQILVNLGSNAGDSMRRQGGMLEIYLSREMLDEKKAVEISPDLAPGPYVRIDVKDTGPGIDAQTLEHIFEPFFTTKGENGGTGLGLSVVHGIVKDHGGAITVESAPGKGTAFAVWLPELKEQGE
jgi:signal transduction histidine kinase